MTASVTANNFLDQTRQGQGLTKRRCLALFHDGGSNSPRRRFFTQITKQPGELFFAITVNDVGSGAFAARIHPHVEWTVAHQTETALCVLELPERDAKIEDGASNLFDRQLIKD